jgi:hypothetical protein
MRELGDRKDQNILNLKADEAAAKVIAFAEISEAAASPAGLPNSPTGFS